MNENRTCVTNILYHRCTEQNNTKTCVNILCISARRAFFWAPPPKTHTTININPCPKRLPPPLIFEQNFSCARLRAYCLRSILTKTCYACAAPVYTLCTLSAHNSVQTIFTYGDHMLTCLGLVHTASPQCPLQCPHSALTVPSQCPHSAHTVPTWKRLHNSKNSRATKRL